MRGTNASQAAHTPCRSLHLGFENSSFLPCAGMPTEARYYDRPGFYWVDMSPTLHRAVSQAADPDDSGMGRMVYVDWLATTTGPGRYGHMGVALYEMEVEAIYKVSATAPESCRPDTFELLMPPPPPPPPPED